MCIRSIMRAILPLLFLGVTTSAGLAMAASEMPPFNATRWVNSSTLTPEALRGKVVVVDFWEFTCINWIKLLIFIPKGIITRETLLYGAAFLPIIPIGVWLGVLPPILISLASFDGWTKPLLVVGLFTVLELALGGFIEPVLYFASDYARDTRTSGSSSAAGGPRPRAGRAGMSCCPRAPTTSVPASSRCAISCRGSRPWRRPPGRRHSAFRSFHRSARRPSAAHLTLPRTVAAILLR